MSIILIGSRALSLLAPQLLNRKCSDFDFVCTMAEYESWFAKNKSKINPTKVYSEKINPATDNIKMIVEGSTNCEFEIIEPGNTAEMLHDLVMADKDSFETPFGMVPSLDMLFTIKSSHIFLRNSPHWLKNLLDYHAMKRAGAIIRPEFENFHNIRSKFTYYYSHPKLNQTKDKFFSDDDIVYKFDHDSIHLSVARGERPAYTYYLKEGAEVECDMKKFFELPHQVRINGVIEEAAVLAIERSLVPYPGVKTPKEAWFYAFSKVCTSITSGRFRKFSVHNALEIMQQYPEGYWEKFQKDVESGLVRPFTGSKY